MDPHPDEFNYSFDTNGDKKKRKYVVNSYCDQTGLDRAEVEARA